LPTCGQLSRITLSFSFFLWVFEKYFIFLSPSMDFLLSLVTDSPELCGI